MDLNLNEKRIIFQILVLVMKADLITRNEEIAILDKVFNEFGLSIEEFDHMDNLDFDYLKKEFSLFSNEHKCYAINLFKEMSSCDGFVDSREIKIIEDLC